MAAGARHLTHSLTHPIHVFVYGTLQPGQAPYDRYCADHVVQVQPAIAFGQLLDLPLGYPAMTLGDRPVHGFVLTFADPAVLELLDVYEGYHPQQNPGLNEYSRQKIETFDPDHQPLGLAWVYLMDLDLAKRLGGVMVPDGRWTGPQNRG